MDGDEFYHLLHTIGEGLDAENIKMIKYLCKDCIPNHHQFQNGHDLLHYMEGKSWITHAEMEFLAEILYWIKRRDLLKLLPGVKSSRDYETNFLSRELYFSTFRITCFLATQELSPNDFQILKNFSRITLSQRNFQRADDIYSLLACLEEEDIFAEGDLQFLLTSLRRLDNQKPLKLFESLSVGDHSQVYPSNKLPQTPAAVRPGFPRQARSLPAFVNPAAPMPYHAPHRYTSFHEVPIAYSHGQSHASIDQRDWPTVPDKTENIDTDGCSLARSTTDAPVLPEIHHENTKFFTGDDYPAPLKPRRSQDSERCKSFLSHAEESNPKPAAYQSYQTTNTDSTQTKDTYSTSNYSDSSRIFSETQHSAEVHCMPSIVDSSGEPVSHLESIDENRYMDSLLVSEADTTAPSVDLSAPTKTSEARIEHYEMNSSPTGICLIINNMNFEARINVQEATRRLKLQGHDYPVPNVGLKDRVGSSLDIKKVSDLFKSFGFEVVTREDLDSRAMLNLLANFSRKDHSSYDCFVLIVMSHGALGSIYGVDGMPVRCAEIKSIFKPASCPTLLNKPKIFFFQACQGDQVMDGHSTAPVADVDDIETDGHALPMTTNTPSEADFLICYSTVPGYISYRSRSNGSFFINFVVDNLKTLHPTEDVLSIMTHVNLQLANHSLNQTAMPVSTLRKKVFFKQQNQA